jgi:GNAT superfamily N-acetyltransferase
VTVSLRAIDDSDLPFLLRVYRSAREPELALLPWNDEQKDAFCAMQFAAQDRGYREAYPDGEFLVIECDGALAGRLYRAASAGSLHVVDITMLPEWRNRGIGTALLRQEITRAEAAGRPLDLHVDKANPARQLYARLGFREIADAGMYVRLQWRSDAGATGR